MIGKFLLSFWILLRWISVLGDPEVAERWPTFHEESFDEKNDPEIFRAVVESMRQWELHRKNHRTKREISKVCYEDVGCFEDTGPFSYLEMLPSPPKEVGTRFLVYGSRKARSIPMEVPAEDISDDAHRAIDPDLPTKVIVHGFGSSCDQVWVYEMRSALMTVHECNIVCVDWEPGSAVPNYVRAAANTRLVGRQLAKFIRSLNISLNKVHLIGFSLGAHVAGFAGAELGNVSRITGLDPAAPLFEAQDPRARLDETDANFVDVIHSNGEQLLLGGLGSWQPMGDVDFYPNGGRMQTGCSNLFLGAVSDIIWSSAVEGRSLCNHRRAYKLFTDSVSPKCRFPAFPCDYGYDGLVRGDCFPCGVNGMDRPCGDMGYYSDESPARGQLYLITRDEEPFCAHQYQVKVYNSRSERPTKSYGKLEVTLIGETFNETFAMTKKDEELLVGVILQKIVVPHPAITNLESIEIKYTAYSGWISSGLVSWSIDKVAIVDSFGKTFSVCKKGLVLESNRLIYLPLYPGECNIPSEPDNATSPGNLTVSKELVRQSTEPKVLGSINIGPFTKDQNYETRTKDGYTVEVFSNEKTTFEKNLGPFTKEQNIQIPEDAETKKQEPVDATDTRRTDSASNNPWSFIDLSNNADTNSLENSEIEIGRGFSGFNFIPRTSPATDVSTKITTTEFQKEIQEPVLQLKKETGRSLKLPEITEPILRPRTTRQNDIKNESNSISKIPSKQEFQESSTAPKSFTVQFLPERLASILAQAERYARQTLLPLISQYTPSFVGGDRLEEPKYFPPLGLIQGGGGGGIDESREIFTKVREYKFEEEPPKTQSKNNDHLNDFDTKKSTENSSNITDEWVPVNSGSGRDSNSVSRSLNIFSENSEWSTSNVSHVVSTTMTTTTTTTTTMTKTSTQSKKMDEWIPIIIPNDETKHTDNLTLDFSKVDEKKVEDVSENKYIPLIDFQSFDNVAVSPSSSPNELSQETTSSSSHIQKIPRATVSTTSTKPQKSLSTGKMMFPYVYERKKDPRTRYIPLIPEEDLGRSRAYIERDR